MSATDAELYAVILFYRGAWCPYCKAQLAAFARARASLRSIGVEIVAVSVDDEAVAAALVDKMRLDFPVGFGAKVPGLGLLLSTVAFHESLNLSLKLGILLIGGGIWIVTNAAVTPPRRPA